MEWSLNQQMLKKEGSRSLAGGAGYATGAGAKPARAQRGDAHDGDLAFLADRGYFSFAPSWVGPVHSHSSVT